MFGKPFEDIRKKPFEDIRMNMYENLLLLSTPLKEPSEPSTIVLDMNNGTIFTRLRNIFSEQSLQINGKHIVKEKVEGRGRYHSVYRLYSFA